MTISKEHREFHELDLATGWRTPAGYPNGIEEKILAGRLDEKARPAIGRDCCGLRPARAPPCLSCTTIGRRFSWCRET